MRTRSIHSLLGLSLATWAAAQVGLDRPLVLSGTTNTSRQVLGLMDPQNDADALNARTARNARFRAAVATGTPNAWGVATTPMFSGDPLPGTELIVRVTAINTGTLTLALDTVGVFPVVKGNGQPLDSGDVVPGMMAALIFDGQAFQLTNARKLIYRPCPSGFIAVNDQFCIEPGQRDTVDFPQAAIACGNMGARLCSWGEFHVACVQAGALGLSTMVGDWEWTDDSANSDMNVRVVGFSSCTIAATNGAIGSTPRNYRCCFSH